MASIPSPMDEALWDGVLDHDLALLIERHGEEAVREAFDRYEPPAMATPAKTYSVEDCCCATAITCEPELILWDGDIDPFTGTEIGWPQPRVYWRNGTITDGWVDGLDKPDCIE